MDSPDGQTDQPTDRQTRLQRCEGASKNQKDNRKAMNRPSNQAIAEVSSI